MAPTRIYVKPVLELHRAGVRVPAGRLTRLELEALDQHAWIVEQHLAVQCRIAARAIGGVRRPSAHSKWKQRQRSRAT